MLNPVRAIVVLSLAVAPEGCPETKKQSNILVKRGKEWHGPDEMTINAHHIIFVEPVTARPTVANLIEQAN